MRAAGLLVAVSILGTGACRPKTQPPQADAEATATAVVDAGTPRPGALLLESTSDAHGIAVCVVRDRDTHLVYGRATAAGLEPGATCANYLNDGKVIRFERGPHVYAKDGRLGPTNDRRLPCDDDAAYATDMSSCVVNDRAVDSFRPVSAPIAALEVPLCEIATGHCRPMLRIPNGLNRVEKNGTVRRRTWDLEYCSASRFLVLVDTELQLHDAPSGQSLSTFGIPRQTTIHHCESGYADTSNAMADPHTWSIAGDTIADASELESRSYRVGALHDPEGTLTCTVTKNDEIVAKATSKGTAPDVECDRLLADGKVVLFRRGEGATSGDYFAKDARLGASNDSLLPCGAGIFANDVRSCIKRGKDALVVCEIPSGECRDLRPFTSPSDRAGSGKGWDARYVSSDLALVVGGDQITLHEIPSGKLVSRADAPRRMLFLSSKDGVVEVIGAKPNGSLFFRVDRDAVTPVPTR